MNLAVSVTINLSIELCFVNGPRETYFVDTPRTYMESYLLFCELCFRIT